MKTRGHILSWALCFLLTLPTMRLAAQIEFVVEMDSREFAVNETFQIAFTVKNGQPVNFRPPDWNELDVIQGPSKSVHTSFVNGKMSSQVSFIYLVMSSKPGVFNLGPAKVEVNNRQYATQPILIRVKKRDQMADADVGEEPFFIRASLDTTHSYIGQQVILEYKLYTRSEINTYDILRAPAFEGLYYRTLPQFQVRTQRERVGGVVYSTRVLRRMALFPQQSGTISIEPMVFQLGVVSRDQNARSFFFSSRIRTVQLSSNELKLHVASAPEPVPDDFTGVVGSFAYSTKWSTNQLNVNDALSLQLRISTDGDPKQLTAPELDLPESFDIYPPKLISEDINESSGRSLVNKTWEYLVVPTEPGVHRLSLRFSYLNPDSSRYIQRTSPPWQLRVSGGSGLPGHSDDLAGTPPRRIHTPAGFDEHRPNAPMWWGRLWFWLLCATPFTAGLIVARIHFLREKENGESETIRNYKKARKKAQQSLEKAKQTLGKGHTGAFYEALSEAILGYTAHRLKLSPNSITRASLRKELGHAGVESAATEEFLAFWDKVDAARYAPGLSTANASEDYDRAIALISQLEAALEKV